MNSSRRLDLEKVRKDLIENKAFLDGVEKELNPTVCIVKKQKTMLPRNLKEDYEAPQINEFDAWEKNGCFY